MIQAIAALLAGPEWQPPRRRQPARVLAAVPLLLLAMLVASASIAGITSFPLATLGTRAWHIVPLAFLATLLSVLSAWPVAATKPGSLAIPGPGWLVPAWAAVGGGAACALTNLPPAVVLATWLLPIAAFGLAAAWSRIPGPLWEAAAASGAGRLQARLQLLPIIRPALSLLVAVLFALALTAASTMVN